MKKLLLLTLFGLTIATSVFSDSCEDICPDCDACELSQSPNDNHIYYGKTLFHQRETDTAQRLMGASSHIHLWGKECCWYGVISGTLGYTQTEASCDLGQYFSFNQTSPCMLFSSDSQTAFFAGTGDEVLPNSASNARAADFGLSASFSSEARFKPQIRNIIVDLDLFMGLNCIWDGLWARVAAPIVHATYDIDFVELDQSMGTTFYPAGFVDSGFVTVPYNTVKSAWEALGSFGDVAESSCGRIDCRSTTKTRVARVDIDLGYEILNCDCANVGVSIRGTIGTSNPQRASALFNVVTGAYNNQLGGTLNARATLWQCYEDQRVNLYFYGIFTHLFGNTDTRILGLKAGGQTAGNSWLLLKQFDDNGAYTGNIFRATSALSRKVKVRNDFLTDFSVMLQWQRYCLDISIGWNFWYRTKDKYDNCINATTDCEGCAFELTAGNYGIKGVANVGTANDDTTFYSKSDSNIHASGTRVAASNAPSGVALASASDYVVESDVCPEVAMHPSTFSNKLFGYIGYSWDGYHCPGTCFSPYAGLAGMYEWGSGNRSTNQWGVYLKAGLNF